MIRRAGWVLGFLATSVEPAVAQQISTASVSPASTSSVTVTSTTSQEATASAKGWGGIRGRVVDAKTGEALIEATVKVVRGGVGEALTDVDGNYELPLAPGAYELRIFYDVYQARRLSGVVVRKGEVAPIDVELSAAEDAIQEVVVEARADTRKEAAVLKERQRAAVMADAVSAQEVARSGDGTAAAAVRRVVGITLRDGRYVQIRGLGDRYTPVLLNSVVLPSIEPDEYAVPLDLFPASLLANMKVLKTHDPTLPGSFGGGALVLSTNQYPEQLELKLRLTTGLDSASTFRSGPTYAGSSLDFLGFDASRALGDAFDPSSAVPEERENSMANLAAGRSLSSEWTPGEARLMPPFSLGGTIGNSVELGRGWKLGVLAATSFASTRERADIAATRFGIGGERLVEDESGSTLRVSEGGVLGALADASITMGRNDRLELFSFYGHDGTRRTLKRSGFSRNDQSPFQESRLLFIERGLWFSQLFGEHTLPKVGGLKVSWQANFSMVNRDEPDARENYRLVLSDGRDRLRASPYAERLFWALADRGAGTGVDLTLPFPSIDLKAGASLQHSARSFQVRRFRYEDDQSDDGPRDYLEPTELFLAPDRLGGVVEFVEATRATDGYAASLLVLAGYGAVEVRPLESLRLAGGLRYEHSNLQLSPNAQLAISGEPGAEVDRREGALLPSVNAILALASDMNLRAAYSFTLARPNFRELSAPVYFDYERRVAVSGNPELVETRIHNVDVRWEWFFGEDEVFAATLFGKGLLKPIERVYDLATQLSFANAAAAVIFGGELEARVGLGRLLRPLEDLRAGGNLSLIGSRIELLQDAALVNTSRARPLQGQAPYVLNLYLSYLNAAWGTELTLLFNVTGARITEVGTSGLPDVYEAPSPRLDLVVSQKLGEQLRIKATASNLLGRSVTYLQGDQIAYERSSGVIASIAAEWAP